MSEGVESVLVTCVSMTKYLAKAIKEGRVCSGSQLESTVRHGGRVTTGGACGYWSHGVWHPQVENRRGKGRREKGGESWCSPLGWILPLLLTRSRNFLTIMPRGLLP